MNEVVNKKRMYKRLNELKRGRMNELMVIEWMCEWVSGLMIEQAN